MRFEVGRKKYKKNEILEKFVGYLFAICMFILISDGFDHC
jgi:hypothetical protein